MTNIQKPPVYKQVLPRVLETMTNNEHNNNHDKNITLKLPLSPSPPSKLPLLLPTPKLPTWPMSSDNNIKEHRQSRVDRILEKYRRQPSNSTSRLFSRSFSCNATTEPALLTESNPLHARTVANGSSNEENKSHLAGPQSVSPHVLVDCSNLTCSARQKNNTNTANSSLLKSYSLKSLSDSQSRTSSGVPLATSITKSNNNATLINNDDDPPSSASSSSTATTANSITSKNVVAKEDINQTHCSSSNLMDWMINNCNEETVSDRIRRRSFYVKLK